MKYKGFIFFFMCVVLVSGCSFFPEPVSLIQAPQSPLNNENKDNLLHLGKKYIPEGTSLAVQNKPVVMSPMTMADFNNDGINELVFFYKSNGSDEKVGAVILEKDDDHWNEISHMSGSGYEVSWGSASDITGDGVPELLFGWKMGVSAGSKLEIYTFQEKTFQKIAQLNYHDLELIYEENDPLLRLAVWKRELADVYSVDVLRWGGSSLNIDKELTPSYFLKVAEYYEQRAISVPDTAYYWYYLADSYVKANRQEDAIAAIEKGLALNRVSPLRNTFLELQEQVELAISQNEAPDVQYYISEANMTLKIPKNLYPYFSMEHSEGDQFEYIVDVNIEVEGQKHLLFSVEVLSKDFISSREGLKVIGETESLIYTGKFNEKIEGNRNDLVSEAVAISKEIMSSIKVGPAFPEHISQTDEEFIDELLEAYKKFTHVQMGGEMESGLIESFTHKDLDYRYLGEDIGTTSKFNEFLSSSFTKEAIQEFKKSARIIEHNGKLAQPNADGGTLLSYNQVKVVEVKDFGNEKQFVIKVPIGNSLTYEIVAIDFQKTEEGWRISSNPNTVF
ncbi:DL-endopeptidase inhibitor IseA family protein [Cytobacillus sp. FJAT-54145]|uniref:DL-endopeptidase inhibitor IseA family protein n=1 Tax=Cytobacillus spartinae TaxID=3299023 RepID=A0ABW6KBC3_9BACI